MVNRPCLFSVSVILLSACSEYDLQKEFDDPRPPQDTATIDTADLSDTADFSDTASDDSAEPEEPLAEPCNGIDDDGDGFTDEDHPDSDGDGIADCVDEEECDGVDNNGNGLIDEGFDADEDFTPDCQETTYEITGSTTGDDIWEGWVDGDSYGSFSGWGTVDTLNFTLNSGRHVLAAYGYDTGQTIVGFLSEIKIDGVTQILTGDGAWVSTGSNPGAGWTDIGFDDSSWTRAIPCSDTSPWGGQPASLLDIGARWVWADPYGDCQALSDGWFRFELILP